MKNIIIFGASGHSKVIIDIIHKNKNYNIIGLIDSNKEVGKTVYGYKVLGKIKNINDLKVKYNIFGVVIGIGDNFTRKKIKDKIDKLSLNLEYIPVVHPSAVLANDIIVPEGTVVMAGAIINADAIVGKFCILNSKSSLGHDSTMGDYSSLASGVTVGGTVKIGAFSAICLNASIINNIEIGKHTVIGASALVISPIGDYKKAFGVPINKIKDRAADSKYF